MKKLFFAVLSALCVSSSCMAAATGNHFENLIVCVFPHDTSTAMELASNLMNIAATNSQSFGFAIGHGTYGKYCQMAHGNPSQSHISNARLVISSGNLNYWVAPHDNAAIGFTSDR